MAIIQGRTTTNIISGGYPGEDYGASGGLGGNWVNVNDVGSTTATYYFTDSRTMQNENSSRVNVTLQDSWRILNVDDNNNVILQLTTKILGISRGNLRGSTSGTRNMFVRQTAGGGVIWATYNDNIATAHTISGAFNIGTYTYTIAPQSTWNRTSVYFRSNVSGHDGDSPPSIYVDEMSMGVGFKNVLPIDYRPGKVLDPNGVWQSHNRTTGASNIYNGSNYRTMRSSNGGVGTNDPPFIRHPAGMRNMRKIGNGR